MDALRDVPRPEVSTESSRESIHDALCALRGELSGPRFRLPDREFAAFYRRAMALALAAPVIVPRTE